MNFGKDWNVILYFCVGNSNIITPEILESKNEIKIIQSFYSSKVMSENFDLFINSSRSTKKSIYDSNLIREEGNILFRNDKQQSAKVINIYTKAIFKAPPDSQSASLAHANRAAALMELKMFKEAFDDCECAIELDCPQEIFLKVCKRQAFSAVQCRNKEQIEILMKNIEKLHNEYEEVSAPEHLQEYTDLKSVLLELATDPEEPKLPTEKKQKILTNPMCGRYVVAGEKIYSNERIMTEKAFAFVPIYEDLNSYEIHFACQNCGEDNIIPFPCNTCGSISYCSRNCRDNHKYVHSFECEGSKKNIFHEIGIAHLALRALLIGFQSLLEKLCSLCPIKRYKIKGIWAEIFRIANTEKFPYGDVLLLVSNLDKMSNDDFAAYSLTGGMLAYYLKNYTSFFNTFPAKCFEFMKVENWEILVAALLTKHIGQMISNAHSIVGLKPNVTSIEMNCWQSNATLNLGNLHLMTSKTKIFAAIYPQISLYNHSCEPNIRNSFNKTSLTVTSTKNIKKGEQIFNCYGPHFKMQNQETRKSNLKAQYAFECECKHCTNHDEEFKRFHKVNCEDCQKHFDNVDWSDWLKNFRKIQSRMWCPKCPIKYVWFNRFCKAWDEKSPNFKHDFMELYICYTNLKKFLSESHELKQKIAFMIIKEFIGMNFDPEINTKLLELGTELLNATEDQFGLYSFEFVLVATFFLDLVATRKYYLKTLFDNYDLEKIHSSFSILSDKMKEIFENYWNLYIK